MSKSKKIWITGGGSGIGQALAWRLADQGNHVVISGRRLDKLENTIDAYHKDKSNTHGKIDSVVFDVSQDGEVEQTAQQLREKLGGVDVAILSAGVCEYIDNAALDTALFRRVFDANLFGTVNAIQVALKLMVDTPSGDKAGRPHLVLVSSMSTLTGLPRAEAYGSSKAALDYLGDSLGIGLRQQGVDVTVIQPGFVETPMTKQNNFSMPFAMSADDAASRIARVLEKRPRVFRFPNRLVWLIQSARFIPYLWYKKIAPKMVRSS